MVKGTSWTNIGDSVQIFEYLNKLPSKSPLYKANEFQVRVNIYGFGSLESFCRFSCCFIDFLVYFLVDFLVVFLLFYCFIVVL